MRKSTFRLHPYQPVDARRWVVDKRIDAFDVYIGRSTDETTQHFGNPFSFNTRQSGLVAVSSVAEEISRHNSWLRGESDLELKQDQRQWILKNLNSLRGRRLGCFCARKNGVGLDVPKVCHGQNYLQILHELDTGILRIEKREDLYVLRKQRTGGHLGITGPTYSKLTGVQREQVRFDLMAMLLMLSPNSYCLHIGDCNGVDKLVRDGAKSARLRSTIYRKNFLLPEKVQVAELMQQLMEGLALHQGRLVAWVNDTPPAAIEPSAEMMLTSGSPLWNAIAYAVAHQIPLTVYPLVPTLTLPGWVPDAALSHLSPSTHKSILYQHVFEILSRWLSVLGTGNAQIKKTVEDRCYQVVQHGKTVRLIAVARDCCIFESIAGEVTVDRLITEDLENLLRVNHQILAQIAVRIVDLCQQACCVFGLGEFNTGRTAWDDNYRIFQAKGVLTLTAHDGRQEILRVKDGQVVHSTVTLDDLNYFLKVQEHIRDQGRPRKIIEIPRRFRQPSPVKSVRQ